MWLEDTWTTGITAARGALTLARLKDGSPRREHTPSCHHEKPKWWQDLPSPCPSPGRGCQSPGILLDWTLVLCEVLAALLWVGMGMGWPTRGTSRGLGWSPWQDGKCDAFSSPSCKIIPGWQVQSVIQGGILPHLGPAYEVDWVSFHLRVLLVLNTSFLEHEFSHTSQGFGAGFNLVRISGCFFLIYICWGTETEEILNLNLRITRWFKF